VTRLIRRERPLSWAEVEEHLGRLSAPVLRPGSGPALSFAEGPGAAPAPRPGPGPAPAPAAARPPAAATGAPPAPAAPAAAARPAGGGVAALGKLPGGWPSVLDAVKRAAPAAYVYLKSAACVGAGDGVIRLELASSFHREGLSGGGMKALVEGALSAAVGEPVRIQVSAGPGAGAAPAPAAAPAPRPGAPAPRPSSAPPAGAPPPPAGPTVQELADREPLVKAGLEIFKARLVGHKKAPAK